MQSVSLRLQASLPTGLDPARLQALIDRAMPTALPDAGKRRCSSTTA